MIDINPDDIKPKAAKDQISKMVGLNFWELSDQQRQYLYLWAVYSAFGNHCPLCGEYHRPFDIATDQFSFDKPLCYTSFACPAKDQPIELRFGYNYNELSSTPIKWVSNNLAIPTL